MTTQEIQEDQHYIQSEFQRANTLMQKLSDEQHRTSMRKLELEKEIMDKGGVDDAELWVQLRSCRSDIDAMAEEKMLLVAKLYNLTQRFVMELDISTAEISKQIDQSKMRSSHQMAHQFDVIENSMQVSKKSQVAKAAGKQFDEIEPVASSDPQFRSSQKDIMSVGQGAGQKRSRANQQRASDGKFESFGDRSRKQQNYNIDFGGSKGQIEPVPTGRKSRGSNKRGGGGDVGRAFYEGQVPASQDSLMSQSSVSAALSNPVMYDQLMGDEENKSMHEVQGATEDQEYCHACQQARPQLLLPNDYVTWIMCESCEKWYHVICMKDKLLNMGISDHTEDGIRDVNFHCCTA